MIECPSCGRMHRPGTLFCNECGIYLPTGAPLGTEPIPDEELPAAKAYAWKGEAKRQREGQGDAVLRISIPSTERQIQLSMAEDVQIGRLDSSQGILPDVDLTSDGGLKGGVSRRHCKIFKREGDYYIEDLGSANGTFLDGERLTPYLPHVLRDGDELQLGRLELEIIVTRVDAG